MKKQTCITVMIVALIAAGSLAYGQLSRSSNPAQEVASSFVTVSLSINDILPTTDTTVTLGSTALSLLSKVAQEMALELGTKEFPGMGILVEKIGDLVNGTDGKYWHFYVNGKLAPVGASDYVVKQGDVIEWKFIEPDTAY